MSEIKSFSGIRFEGHNISRFICPPYDVISDKRKAKLKKLSPFNMVRLELPDPHGKRNKYLNSAHLFSLWQKKGILKKDILPALYFYEQKFVDHGRKMVRRGFFGALRLENPFKGSVKPHEKTLSKPKEDRLKMLRAAKANLSPIFGLFHNNSREIVKLSEKLAKTKENSISKDFESTIHRLWKITDPKVINLVKSVLKKNKIFIADGHHRYETAWNYLNEQIKKKARGRNNAFENVLIYLCPMEDKGLSIWPTHRVVVPPKDLEQRINNYFRVFSKEKFERLSRKSPQPLLIYKDGKFRTLVAKNMSILDKAMKGKCRAYKNLGVSILHSVLLTDVLPENITYVKDEKEACRLAKEKKCAAVMVPATPVESIKEIALAGQTMPQKSTYFFPKVASGQVIHSVSGVE
ncbi:MAG: DUF1015 domain-containing protein [Elusimicrobia bacterium]|nr:DUF1015 domain-containing protein [Elusimicrobiota bacterium]